MSTLLVFIGAGLPACSRPPTGTPTPTLTTGAQNLGGAPTTAPPTVVAPTPTTAAPTPTEHFVHSTMPNRAGYVWASNATSSYMATGNYWYNSGGGVINISRYATGRYVVDFVGLGDVTTDTRGIAHAQAYGTTSNYCNVQDWDGVSGNMEVAVNCYTAAGAYADTRFVANWAEGSQDNAMFGYLWANDPSNPATYTPPARYRYDAYNPDDLSVTRLSTGRYEVHLPIIAVDEPAAPYAYQITAVNSNRRCKLHSNNLGAAKAVVACRTPAGANADSRFSISYSAVGSMIGRVDRSSDKLGNPSAYYTGGITNSAVGVYTAELGLNENKGHVVSLATGTTATYCHIRNWSVSGTHLNATSVCYTTGGVAANSGIFFSASK
ncbi:MAG: hypothetical protein ACM30G_14545 [Micromonosporaceae bacterium]